MWRTHPVEKPPLDKQVVGVRYIDDDLDDLGWWTMTEHGWYVSDKHGNLGHSDSRGPDAWMYAPHER